MSHKVYDLVFEGGGAKGSTLVGAMKAFYEKGYTARRLVGTSAGAITATLVAAGYTPDEMLKAVNEQKDGKPRFASFMDMPKAHEFDDHIINNSDTMAIFKYVDIPLVPQWSEENFDQEFIKALMSLPLYRQLFNFAECGGLFSGNEFLVWIREKLAAKGFSPDITLAAFHAHPHVKNELSLVTSDTDTPEMLVLNHRTAPHCPLAWAVRMSMSIPFVWREVVWQQSWGTYLGENITGHRIVDGGVLSNFPIALVDNDPLPGSYIEKVMGTLAEANAKSAGTIGLLIDESIAVTGQPENTTHSTFGGLKSVKRISRLIDTMTGAHDNDEMRTHRQSVCRLPAKGYGTTEFDMPPDRLKALIDGGFNAMSVYLELLEE